MEDKILGKKMKVYDLAVIFMVMQVMLDRITYIEGDTLSKLFTVASLGLFVLVIVFENTYTPAQVAVIGIVGAVALYSGMQMGEYFLVMTVVLSIASLEKDTERTITIMHKVKMLFVVISVIWYVCFEIIPGKEQLTIITGVHNPHKFGFTNANAFALVVTWMIFERVYLSFDKMKPRHIIALAISGPAIYYLTACDTAMYVLIFATLVIWVCRLGWVTKFMTFGSHFVFGAFALFNVFCVYYYAHKSLRLHNFLMDLDDLLSARIRETAQIYSLYGPTALGQEVDLGGEVAYDTYYRITTLICDGLFSYLYVCLGYINTIILVVMIFYTAYQKKKRDCIFIFIYTLYAIMETHGLNAYFAFPILIYQRDFFKAFNRVKKKEEEAVSYERTDQNSSCRVNG